MHYAVLCVNSFNNLCLLIAKMLECYVGKIVLQQAAALEGYRKWGPVSLSLPFPPLPSHPLPVFPFSTLPSLSSPSNATGGSGDRCKLPHAVRFGHNDAPLLPLSLDRLTLNFPRTPVHAGGGSRHMVSYSKKVSIKGSNLLKTPLF